MVVFASMYRKLAVVDSLLFGKVVKHENLLQLQISGILFIFKYQEDGTEVPGVATAGAYTFFIKDIAEFLLPVPINVKVEDFLHNNGFVRYYGDLTIYKPILKYGAGGSTSFIKSLSDTPFAVGSNGKALRMGKRSKKRQHDFAVCIQDLDVLLFKENIDPEFIKLTNRPQERERISSKATDRFCEDYIDVSCSAVCKELLKLLAAFLGVGFRLVCIDSGELPIGVAADKISVVMDLRIKRV